MNRHLSELWSEGSSLVPTPSCVSWYDLLKSFDNFKHKVICKVHYYDTSNKTEQTNDGIKTPIIKSQGNAVDLKCKIPEVETFLRRIEQEIISDTLKRKYKL